MTVHFLYFSLVQKFHINERLTVVSEEKIMALADIAQAAQVKIQKDFKNIDPVIGVMRGLRTVGFATDAMTIDCLVSGKRIILLLHDEKPEEVAYQFSFKDKDPNDEFLTVPLSEATEGQFYTWIKTYFSTATR